jgi:hypothetical protein
MKRSYALTEQVPCVGDEFKHDIRRFEPCPTGFLFCGWTPIEGKIIDQTPDRQMYLVDYRESGSPGKKRQWMKAQALKGYRRKRWGREVQRELELKQLKLKVYFYEGEEERAMA